MQSMRKGMETSVKGNEELSTWLGGEQGRGDHEKALPGRASGPVHPPSYFSTYNHDYHSNCNRLLTGHKRTHILIVSQ